MSDIENAPVRWSVEQRLAFIDRRLFWDGKINRSNLVGHFSISVPQASADLSQYDEAARGNMAYDKHAKAYLATPAFRPRTEPSAREYLAQLQLIADGVLREEESWLGWLPPFGLVPRVRRKLAADVLQSILGAIRSNHALNIEYQSMSTQKPSVRWVVPHALSFDGHRWHMRAWCHKREKFLDFVLARILGIESAKEDQIDPNTDRAWHETTVLRLGANPALPAAQQRAIALDYGMQAGYVEVIVRRSLVYYLARHLLLDVSHQLPPERVQVVLLNMEQVNDDLAAVGEATIGGGANA